MPQPLLFFMVLAIKVALAFHAEMLKSADVFLPHAESPFQFEVDDRTIACCISNGAPPIYTHRTVPRTRQRRRVYFHAA